MNRQERRSAGKGQSDERVVITGLVAHFENGQYAPLDINKITVIDKDTGRPLFDEVLDASPQPGDIVVTAAPGTPDHSAPLAVGHRPRHDEFHDETKDSYSVAFDTPEGRMEYVKNGNWSGVRPAKG